ncbi:peroxide stress protein YaaA [uncultured Oscillibacter sp.]|uniref:peroxide stress protein YaaA n=1 Tax=uncultured Oscillibacter sp. TaxID=876091 RepID=UPI002615EE48|nr:peroxide stress protein YaaA [uncultured Oscillibacter sp.]
MRIIIAPAKKMVVDTDSFAVDSLPQFLEQTERLEQMDLYLYQFWGNRLARQLASETDVVLNLASKEYSRAIVSAVPCRWGITLFIFGYSPPRIEPFSTR